MDASLAAQRLATPRTTIPASYSYGMLTPALNRLFGPEPHPIRSCLLAIRLFGLTPSELLRFDAKTGLAQICCSGGEISLPRRSSTTGWLRLRAFSSDDMSELGQVALTQGHASTLAPGPLTRTAWRRALKQRGYSLGETLGVKDWLHDLRSAFACTYYDLVLGTVPPVFDPLSAAPADEASVLKTLCAHLNCPAERLPAFIGARAWR